MLQALLAERFGLKVHRENREHNVYALVTARGGHKLKESPPDTGTPLTPPDAPSPSPNNTGGVFNINGTEVRVDNRGGGATVTTPENGAIRTSMSPDGQMRMEFEKVTTAQFAGMLTRFVDRPVVDMTEIKGNYQIALELSLADMLNVARASGIGLPPLGGARGGNPALPAQASDPSSNSIFTSVQQLGLRLDSRKAPVEVVVVDHVERMPTEN